MYSFPLPRRRREAAMLLYAGATAAAYFAAFLIRFDFQVPSSYLGLFAWSVWPLVLIRLLAFRTLRLTRERWRYVGVRDVVRLVAGTAVASVIFLMLFRVLLPLPVRVPVAVILAEMVFMCWITAGMWVSYRLVVERMVANGMSTQSRRRVVIVGAGDAGNLLAREMLRVKRSYFPVAFVDDAPWMWGATLQGVEVVGATSELAAIVRATNADEVVIAIPSATPAELRRIVECCEGLGLPFKVLPGVAQVLAGEVTLTQLREVRIEDLLGREPIVLELPELAADLSGRCVLITGAAGSIGSELSRQVALHRPGRLILFDQAETDLFYLERELHEKHPELACNAVVGDIVDESAVLNVFERFAPDRVFHAAAYKHVCMMESNVREAVRNNVIGTMRVARAAAQAGTEKFVLVSTDKAVRPSNVMGATKRLAELLIMELQARYPKTAFGAVRFGNVLGSQGSVIPIFRRQLAAGKPLTVTDPDATRYFMTIAEAVQLVLQVSVLPELRGHIAMLEMGDPVRIRDLARNLLRISGVAAPDARIVYTGLRPGEKLHEELSAPEEESVATSLEKVRLLRSRGPDLSGVAQRASAWESALDEGDDESVHEELAALFPGAAGLMNGRRATPPPAIEVRTPDRSAARQLVMERASG